MGTQDLGGDNCGKRTELGDNATAYYTVGHYQGTHRRQRKLAEVFEKFLILASPVFLLLLFFVFVVVVVFLSTSIPYVR